MGLFGSLLPDCLDPSDDVCEQISFVYSDRRRLVEAKPVSGGEAVIAAPSE
jgi:hypothetical protein